ncbi:MAG: single-stranded DNA-binding protein [Patescibacteria group bacterium]|nr:single-stranded DNA-binding protein [Patescibacteria group bacterium]
MYLNKAFVYGNLTRDPELRSLPSGGNVCSFSIATNRVFKKADGSKQEQVEFHNVVVFGRQAETCAQYLKKGSPALVEGHLQTRNWEGEKGKQYKTEIIAERVQFGPRGAGSRQGEGGAPFAPNEVEEQKAPKEEGIDYPQEDINPDDIPF